MNKQDKPEAREAVKGPAGPNQGLTPPTVFIVDDEEFLRKILSRQLRSAGYEVETFASAREFLDRSPFQGSGCILLDINMPGLTGVELQEEMSKAKYAMPIIFITGSADLGTCVRVMKKGAENFLTKPFDVVALLDAVRLAVDKDRKHRREYEARLRTEKIIASLTPRESQVMDLLTAGKLNKQIAAELGIAEITVKVHRRELMKKFGVASVVDLMRVIDIRPYEEQTGPASPAP